MSDNTLGSSSPCKDCHRKLLSLGIKRIVYSDNDKQFVRIKPDDYVPYGNSTGRRYIENDYKYTSKKQLVSPH